MRPILLNNGSMRVPALHQRTLWLIVALWLGASAAGLAAMSAYANRPGAAAQAPPRWPAGSRLVLDAVRPTLVMVAHPKCDCTRASLVELRELLARTPGKTRAYVVFVEPATGDATWGDTVLWNAARAIPDLIAVRDHDGREGKRFGAQTSGQAFLYGPDGALWFSGGATIARGHEGENPGLAAMLTLIAGRTPSTATTPVFGCPIFDEHSRATTSEGAL